MKTQTLCYLWGKAYDGATGEEKEGALDAEFVPADVARGLLDELKASTGILTSFQKHMCSCDGVKECYLCKAVARNRHAIAAAEAE